MEAKTEKKKRWPKSKKNKRKKPHTRKNPQSKIKNDNKPINNIHDINEYPPLVSNSEKKIINVWNKNPKITIFDKAIEGKNILKSLPVF
jgi:hypothetical protein